MNIPCMIIGYLEKAIRNLWQLKMMPYNLWISICLKKHYYTKRVDTYFLLSDIKIGQLARKCTTHSLYPTLWKWQNAKCIDTYFLLFEDNQWIEVWVRWERLHVTHQLMIIRHVVWDKETHLQTVHDNTCQTSTCQAITWSLTSCWSPGSEMR